MKIRMPDKYSISAILLVVLAGVLIALALITTTTEARQLLW